MSVETAAHPDSLKRVRPFIASRTTSSEHGRWA
jgi:hypothetical protein